MSRDLQHVLLAGQSLSLGYRGAPALSTSPSHASLAPLVEEGVETMSSGFANLVTELFPAAAPILMSAHGANGTAYAGLKKGTASYALGIAQVRAATALAQRRGVGYVVRAIVNVHGETDHTGGSTTYERVVLVGPKYHLPYVDGVHLTNEGYRRMGEDYAKAYARVVLEGRAWEPLRPRSITRAGRIVTVRFVVSVPPLVLDERAVADPGHFGFEVVGSDGEARASAIERVAIAGPDAVAITLSADGEPAPARVRYAATGVAFAGGGPTTGPRGNLRDSDGTRSRHGEPLFNWCVHFDDAIG